MESSTPNAMLETVWSYVKTPYFVAFCVLIICLIIYWYRDSFTPAKSAKSALDKLIDSVRDKQDKARETEPAK